MSSSNLFQQLAAIAGSDVSADWWKAGLGISAVAFAAAFVLVTLSALFAMTASRPRRAAAPPLNYGYALPPLVVVAYLIVLLTGGQPDATTMLQRLMFSWPGLLVGALLFGWPIAFTWSRSAMSGVAIEVIEAATLEGASRAQVMRHILLPQLAGKFVALFLLLFWHIVLGFGLVLMVAAQVPQTLASGLSPRACAAYAVALVLAAAAVLAARWLWSPGETATS